MKYINMKMSLCFLCGIIFGVIICFFSMIKYTKDQFQIISDIYIGNEASETVNCYFGDNDDYTKIYCLKRFIRYLRNNTEEQYIIDKSIAYDIAISTVRIALLYNKVGDIDKFNINMLDAFNFVKENKLFTNLVGTNREIRDSNDLINYVLELNSKHTVKK